jgi:alpha-amylase/alpha-mannosidase (GH57 family)
MRDDRAVRFVLVWHFHQPDYTDAETGAATMPWTRLHALKDYADMAEHLRRHPGVRATINVVPSLLDQLRDLAEGDPDRADPFLAVARKAASGLAPEERRFVVSHFFSFNRGTLARDLRRVQELHALRGDWDLESVPQAVVDRFDDDALRDLQVLFHVAWSGPLLQADPLLRRLREKQRSFSEEDKHALLDLQQGFLRRVIPGFRALVESGTVELSVTPYYHPILPLLADLRSALEALPGMRLPAADFAHPEDADVHLREGLRAFEAYFGRPAAGGWPSEGAISEAALARMGAAGYRWAASDEDVLFASLGHVLPVDPAAAEGERARVLYRPYQHGSGPVLLFRDHDLSDRIGFVYSTWSPDAAAADFLGRLRSAAALVPAEEGPATVSVILDGENAWEYYPDNASEFFEAVYGGLENDPRIRTMTASEAADPALARPLPRVVAGSWIGRNLATWCGHPEKNRAWELLAATRDAVAARRGAPALADPAWRAVLAAEGSDWFWWFGDDHPTPFAHEFDAGFRRKLRAAWRALGVEPPADLSEPIRHGKALGFTAPVGRISPVLDGRVTDYFEWLSAGRADAAGGTMQSSIRLVRHIRFGTDGTQLFLRLDPYERPASVSLAGATLVVGVPGAADRRYRCPLPDEGLARSGPLEVAVGTVVEARLPLASLGPEGERIGFEVEVEIPGGRTQRIPGEGTLFLPATSEDASLHDWHV